MKKAVSHLDNGKEKKKEDKTTQPSTQELLICEARM